MSTRELVHTRLESIQTDLLAASGSDVPTLRGMALLEAAGKGATSGKSKSISSSNSSIVGMAEGI